MTDRYVVVLRDDHGEVVGVLGSWILTTAWRVRDELQLPAGFRVELHRAVPMRELRRGVRGAPAAGIPQAAPSPR